MKTIENFIVAILGIVLLVAFLSALTNPSSSSTDTSSYHDGKSHSGRNTWARINTPPPTPPQQESTVNYPSNTPSPVYSAPSHYYGSGNNHYAELWSECEDLETLLEDNDIEHESLDYPMDYYDLKDLRDEYQSLLDENEIDY